MSQGNWKHGTIQRLELEDRIEPGTSIPDLLDFIRCALQWDPLKRHSAWQLLNHAWLAEMMKD
jgi:serine/threonine protein kinase